MSLSESKMKESLFKSPISKAEDLDVRMYVNKAELNQTKCIVLCCSIRAKCPPLMKSRQTSSMMGKESEANDRQMDGM